MPPRGKLDLIKEATVAIALVPDEPPTDRTQTPFTILGSGFCVDPAGIIATCEHVISAFVQQDMHQVIAEIPQEDRAGELWPIRGVQMLRPHALFYRVDPANKNLVVLLVPMVTATAKVDYDIGFMRLQRHAAFRDGFPYLELLDSEGIHEGMDVGVCGFPMGNELHEQLGTKTSSFTRGILSSIAPTGGIPIEDVAGFQLDLTATHGNSGGPAFCWETGDVLGVVQGGPTRAPGDALPGVVYAESLYRPFLDGTLDRVRNWTPPPFAS